MNNCHSSVLMIIIIIMILAVCGKWFYESQGVEILKDSMLPLLIVTDLLEDVIIILAVCGKWFDESPKGLKY